MSSNEEHTGTLTARVMQHIRHRIAGHALLPGARLPSIRGLAESMQVSKSTVVEAYDRLAAEGAIQPRRGSGFYVAGHPPPLALGDIGPRLDREVDPLWVSRQALEAGNASLKPGCGWLPPEWMPQESLRRALRRLARADPQELTDYASPLGHAPLRQLLSRRMTERGIPAAPDQIMLTESGTQAIDLLCRFLLKPGDTVLLDDPCYFNFHALLRAHPVKIVSVPYTPSGPDVERFGRALADHQPRLYVTNSALHNPTGASMAPVVAHRLLKLAEQHDLAIIEDDIFADFEPEPSPRLAAFDGLDRVIHVSSFSKTFSAAVRCGYVAARPEWIDALADLKIATSYGGGRMAASLVFDMMKDGTYRRHVDELRERLSRAMGLAATRLAAVGVEPWLRPRGGMFLWCRLPEGIDAADMARSALAQDIVLAPGNVFSLSQSASGYLRFNAAQCADARIFEMLDTAIRSGRRAHAARRNRAAARPE